MSAFKYLGHNLSSQGLSQYGPLAFQQWLLPIVFQPAFVSETKLLLINSHFILFVIGP